MSEKKYYAEFEGTLDSRAQSNFEKGIVLKDGSVCKKAQLEILSDNSCNVTIYEGKYHQVKRMLASQGVKVTFLKRLEEGPYSLGNLKTGEVVEVSCEH